ncbi:non-ribosomal peptide synthetase [Kribbella sp. NPDC020789]
MSPESMLDQSRQHDTVLRAIEAWAVRSPQAIALECGGERLTYRQLIHAARLVAADLRRQGVGAETVVGVPVSRSLDTVVAVIGVLLAECAYTPVALDRDFTGVKVSHQTAAQAVRSALANETVSAPAPASAFESPPGLAYVMPTSGSTGDSKLVRVSHANLVAATTALGQALPAITPGDIYLHYAAFTFSSAVRQLFLPLCSGARVLVATEAERLDPAALLARITASGVTVLDLIPSVLALLIDTLEQHDGGRTVVSDSVRLVLLASEPLPARLAEQWFVVSGSQAQLHNMYGLTETAGIVSTYQVVPGSHQQGGFLPIGQPVDGTLIDLVGDAQSPTEEGEITITGPSVMFGYEDGPPTAGNSFRTGDLGRRRPDGLLELVGRLDSQVKIRGYKVDTAEVESALKGHRLVTEAAVCDVPDQAGASRLFALVGLRGEIDVAELRTFLLEQMPAHHVPQEIFATTAMPRTASGKIDRAAVAAELRAQVSTPSTAVDVSRDVAAIWTEVLGRAVGPGDNFFTSGGSSLAAAKVITRIRRHVTPLATIRTMFQFPTLQRFTQEVDRLTRCGD